ncbi:helix-turn-helix domain-containing protein [Blautia wexlerae]|uniref:helix-turn-helix domain-containing protein n=1 Tax=Blautia wexlerae TaxID=418240 RepID=UPI00156DEB6C|nr:helix-turn-helix transcriptional regulator [Blautia wexlerae]NSF65392.1 helix-turn-helix transcriptional regulator [Blautia wexlerae]
MISYEPFWNTLKERNISTYQLINKQGILPDTIQRLRSGRPITTTTINTLCMVIGCTVDQIMEYVPEENEK